MGRSEMIRRRLLAALGAAFMLAACNENPSVIGGQPTELTFSIFLTKDRASTEALWKPILKDLSEAAGIEVRPYFADPPEAQVEAMRRGEAQAGWYSAQLALGAVERADAEVLARPAGLDGDTTYRSVLITRKGRKLTLDDVLKCGRKLTFGIGDAQSASGALAPMTYLFTPSGVEPARCFKSVQAANHQANLLAVANGKLDVAANNTLNLQFAESDNRTLARRIEVIWTSPPLPTAAVVVRRDLDPALKEKIRQFFITYGTGTGPEAERQREVLRRLAWQGFRPADDPYLDPMREIVAGQALTEARRSGDKGRVAAAEANFEKVRAAAAQRRAADPDI